MTEFDIGTARLGASINGGRRTAAVRGGALPVRT
jgi:hypothetical protein